MADLVKITLTGPAKIDGEIRSVGWSGEVGSDIAQQLRDLGAVSVEAGEEPVLVEPVADPRDELIEGLKADIEVLQAKLETYTENASELAEKVFSAKEERDQALARVDELAAQLAPMLLAQTAAAKPAPTATTKKTRAASSS